VSQHDLILETALMRFAHQGIAATTIQDVADHAEVSKASVLYHFNSKEHLVDEVLAPALAALSELVGHQQGTSLADSKNRSDFLESLVNFLLDHRLATHIVVTHPYLADSISSLARANQLMAQLADAVSSAGFGDTERLRFGVAVSGATYALVTAGILGVDSLSNDQLRPLLKDVLLQMTSPDHV
jgi:TetR/AcrR family transcriptional regulator